MLWGWLLTQGLHIQFAHRTFKWRNEAKGNAAVHCVIVGFGRENPPIKRLFEYEDVAGEPHELAVARINPYLVDAPDLVLQRRSKPLCDVLPIGIGSQPIDNGNYLFTPAEKQEFLASEPAAASYFRRWIGSAEFLNGLERWALWLGECPPAHLRKMPLALKRVEAVREFRSASKRQQTLDAATRPTTFGTEIIQRSPYLVLPEVSSERRAFIPIGFEAPPTLSSNLVRVMPNATRYHFGILTSTMHNAWVRTVCGRLKSDYRYSAAIVYNNFPWPDPSDAQRAAIEVQAQAVLDARAAFPGSTLADLYDPLTMPPLLAKSHQKLDAAVDAAYSRRSFKTDAERVAFLFERYETLTSTITAAAKAPRPNRRRVASGG